MAKGRAEVERDRAPDEYPMTIDEFCVQHSALDSRVALLSAFAAEMRRTKRTRALHRDYVSALQEFAGRPA